MTSVTQRAIDSQLATTATLSIASVSKLRMGGADQQLLACLPPRRPLAQPPLRYRHVLLITFVYQGN